MPGEIGRDGAGEREELVLPDLADGASTVDEDKGDRRHRLHDGVVHGGVAQFRVACGTQSGRMRRVPSVAMGSSTRNPGPRVAISTITPSGSLK